MPPPSSFRETIERFHRFNGDEDVRNVILHLSRLIHRRQGYTLGTSQMVQQLQKAGSPTATVEDRAQALWEALSYIRPSDQAYRSVTTAPIWRYLIDQARMQEFLTQADIDAYKGEQIILPSSTPYRRPEHRSENLLVRAGYAVLHKVLGFFRSDPF